MSLAPAPDGTRFATLREVNTESGRVHFNVVLNWLQELEARVPPP